MQKLQKTFKQWVNINIASFLENTEKMKINFMKLQSVGTFYIHTIIHLLNLCIFILAISPF